MGETFLRNHAPDIAAMDLLVIPTIGFKLLYGFVIVRLHRRDLVWINVTANPTAEWVARQITEAFPWDGAPRYMIRDRDRIYGAVVTHRSLYFFSSDNSQQEADSSSHARHFSLLFGSWSFAIGHPDASSIQ